MKKIGVGIIGFGRSGCGIHANALAQMRDRFDVVAICDLLPERRSSEKFPQASPCASAEELLNNPAVELVVVSTFNYTHSAVTIQALRAGKHVLCEKPFGLTVDDVDAMITAAAAGRRVLQPFQQRSNGSARRDSRYHRIRLGALQVISWRKVDSERAKHRTGTHNCTV